MKCTECEFYRNDICIKATKMLSQLDDPVCIGRCSLMLQRDINNNLIDIFNTLTDIHNLLVEETE